MKCFAEIQKLAEEKILDAECLAAGGRYDASFYMAGYAVELYLKAKVCQTLGIENFYDFDDPNRKRQLKDANRDRAFRIHDVQQLLIISGVFTTFMNDLDTGVTPGLKQAWSLIIDWNENTRYILDKTQQQIIDLLKAIKIFETWILQH